ncbi:MAG: DUF362 domain-containing protein [Candidatus Aminicenantia bacterium]
MKAKVYFIPVQKEEDQVTISKKAEKLFIESGLEVKFDKDDFLAIKIHFGEKGNTGFVKPEWLKEIISRINLKTRNAFFTDSNTLYQGNRADAVSHLKIAKEHGFDIESTGLPVIIADGLVGRDYEEVEINQKYFRTVKVARTIFNADSILSIAHLTGHLLTGFGGAIKNIGLGCASRTGKLEQHSDIKPRINHLRCNGCQICSNFCPTGTIFFENEKAVIIEEKCIGCGECLAVCKTGAVRINWDEDSLRVQEKMAEYALGILKSKKQSGFINFLLKVTKDCDCMAKEQPAIVGDIGLLASTDPVAIDLASVELTNQTAGEDLFRKIYSEIDWKVQLEYGAKIGLGSIKYELIEIT